MVRRVLALIAILGGLTFTQTFTQWTERASGGEWYGNGYAAPVAYSVGSPYGYYYYAGYYPYQVVNYPYGYYGYYFPYRYHYVGYPYGYYGNYVTYPITYPTAYVPSYPTGVGYPWVWPAYSVPAGYKVVPITADTEPSQPAVNSDPPVNSNAIPKSPQSANADAVLPPVPGAEQVN